MGRLSFGMRITLCFLVVLVLALYLPFMYYSRALGRDIMREAEARAVNDLKLSAWLMRSRAPFGSERDLDDWIKVLGGRLGSRLTFIVDGKVAADSAVSRDEIGRLDDHGQRPEVVKAVSGQTGLNVRFSRTLGRELIYAALRLDNVAGIDRGVLRLAIPVSDVKERHSRLESNFTLVLGLTLLAAAILTPLLSRGLLASIRELAETAKAIGRGEYDKRIRIYPGKEFKPLVEAVNNMARSIQEQVESLKDQKGQLEAVFNGMSEGVLVLDSKARIMTWNKAMQRIVPEIERYAGRRPLEAMPAPGLHKAVGLLFDGPDGTTRAATLLETPDGRSLEVTLEPFRDDKEMRRVVVVFHDITEIKRLETVRRDFVANVSHELKTPVTSIRGYAETLLEISPSDDATRRKFLGIILKNTSHMSKMIDDLLNLSRLEYTVEKKEFRPVGAQRPLERALKMLNHLSSEKGIKIVVDEKVKDLVVLADSDELQEVFRNLLENAIKFGPKDSQVEVRAETRGEAAVLQVMDQGPGVPDGLKKRIFERFYRIGPHTRDVTGSSGLGLAICKHIVEGFGGSIWVESPVSPDGLSGSAFCFTAKTAPVEEGGD